MRIRGINLARGELARLLKDLREIVGESQRVVAEKTRTSKKQLSAYETGAAMPNIFVFQRLLKHYGYTILVVTNEQANYIQRNL